ncbi:hypothetical protein R1sor_002167 [Riccia sorocarpa]|uniref:non-specific serine/threonine protein kinase n=1 Tax=Riccia sorocarpa TaxID=122646 RepID=A0ABD3H1E7_9MARC
MTIRCAGQYGLWLCLLLISTLNSASAQEPGFISIDCGATSNFTDPVTNIHWTTDASYIRTGINKILSGAVTTAINDKQIKTLRYFPADRSRHCYTLPAASNSTFLVRASFLHGGFQAAVDNSFSISIGSTIVDSLNLAPNVTDTFLVGEYIIKTDLGSDSILFCLLPNGSDAFLNALELRPLAPDMYSESVQIGEYLKFLLRYNCGADSTDPAIRYPDDPYDRAWYVPPSKFSKFLNGKTSRNIPVTSSGPAAVGDRPPMAVLQSAWHDMSWFWFVLTPPDYELELTQAFYVNMFFAEVDDLGPSDVREFSVSLDNKMSLVNLTKWWPGPYELYNPHRKFTSAGTNFSFQIVPDATFGPVLNALELYSVREVESSSTSTADVSALDTFKALLGLSSWTGDPCFPIPYSWLTCDQDTSARVITINLSNYNLTGTIPASVADLTALTDLWLDNNKITGSIPDLSKLTKLTTLHLQNNSISGAIPDTLATLTSLKELWLSNNQLSGPIPAALYNRKDHGLDLKTDRNKNLCGPTENCKVVAPVTISKGGGSKLGPIIGGAVGGVVALIVIVGLLVFCFCRKSFSRKPALPVTSLAFGDTNIHHTCTSVASSNSASNAAAVRQARPFTLKEVEHATNNYKDQIGVGGYGPVFYGKLTDGTEVAVKLNSDNSEQGRTEFLNEVSFLSVVHHKNLVSLLGYCEDDGHHILLYEFMPSGTLREHLYGKDMLRKISWRERLDIALNAAKGLEYLHNDCVPRIIHRDIKSNNILLSDKLLAKVADFGISRSTPEDDTGSSGVSTLVKGTTGYLDPEYYTQGKLTQKSDVYSFGVVLLEIICGRPPILQTFIDPQEHMLVEWARGQMNSNNLESIIDPHIRGTYNREAMWKLAELAMDCVEPHGVNRPDMNQVVRALIIAVESEEQATRTQVYSPTQPSVGGGRNYSADTVDYPLTYSTDNSSLPPTEGPFAPTYPPNGSNSSAPASRFASQETFSSVSLDPDTDSSWMNPKPR